ncbi:LamG domain-containing protein [Streptomyces sp. NPDC048442]|uniref:LamG domain-containing protein n=1 Tax=Streptomyces sp. NPDC048442 TaxID=3154823 RepID=UPI00342A4D8A
MTVLAVATFLGLPATTAGAAGQPAEDLPPQAPTITSLGPYEECAAQLCAPHGGPRTAGRFTFAPQSVDTDVVRYRYRLMGETGARTADGSTVTVDDVVPGTSGVQVLTVEAGDLGSGGTVRWGAPAEFHFKVSTPGGPVGQWHFDDAAPGSTKVTAADSATEGPRLPMTLHQQGGRAATWSEAGRRGGEDRSLRLNDDVSDPRKRLGYAATDSAPVDSAQSFTLSSWVLLTDDTADRAVASAAGAYGSAYRLSYAKDLKKWVFGRAAADSRSNPVEIRSVADAAPVKGVWTHLAGVFDTQDDTDRANDTVQLYVNGRAQGAPVVLSGTTASYTPWTAKGALQIGRAKSLGVWRDHFSGRIDEVRVWQRPLNADEVREESALRENSSPRNALVAQWDTAYTAGGAVPERTPYATGALKLSPTGATAHPAARDVTLDGVGGHLSVRGPAVDETGSFTVTAKVRLDGAQLAAKPVGYRGIVFSQAAPGGKESSWALWVDKVDEGLYVWRYGRNAVDAQGNVRATATVTSYELAQPDEWVQLTGVFDAQEQAQDGAGRLRLFTGLTEQGAPADFTVPTQGTGELSLGRGAADGTVGHYLPGAVAEARVWTGAMGAGEVAHEAVGAE